MVVEANPKPFIRQRDKRVKKDTPHVTCPICTREDIALTKEGRINKHNPNQEWKWTPWCGGGGMTVEEAEVQHGLILKLRRESVVLRQIELGIQLTQPKKPGAMVGSSQETLNARGDRYHDLALGVDHSADLMQGLPYADDISD